jgi:hypothetical protein
MPSWAVATRRIVFADSRADPELAITAPVTIAAAAAPRAMTPLSFLGRRGLMSLLLRVRARVLSGLYMLGRPVQRSAQVKPPPTVAVVTFLVKTGMGPAASSAMGD